VGKVCIPIVESTTEKALVAVKEVSRRADLIELRVDYLKRVNLDLLLEDRRKPLIVTQRRKEEGGRYQGEEGKRASVLRDAIDSGADYIDVEVATERSVLQNLLRNRGETQVILSSHNLQGTPSPEELRRGFNQMVRLGADVVKIVPYARSWEDNLTILSLIPFAKARKKRIVAFCMGEKGKLSRIFSPFLGAAWTYVSFKKVKVSAPGQLTVREMREVWKLLKR